MKPKTLILMVVAVTCGLGASYMTSRLLAQRGDGETEEPVNILVTAKSLSQGMTIKNTDGLFTEKPFIRGTEPKDAILDPKELKGKVLKRTLRAGDFITPGDLLSEKDGLPAMMAEGYRAVGVRVNMESTAGGFASLPLSRVDIISTVRRGSDEQSFAQVLLENVLVLGVDTNINRDEQGRAMPGNVVILALQPEDMLKVAIAKELGPLSLALRGFNDDKKTDVARVSMEQLMTKKFKSGSIEDVDALPAPPAVQPKTLDVAVAPQDPKYRTHELRILEGVEQKVTTYRLDETGEVLPREAVPIDSGAPPRPTPTVTPPAATPPVVAPPAIAPEGTTPAQTNE